MSIHFPEVSGLEITDPPPSFLEPSRWSRSRGARYLSVSFTYSCTPNDSKTKGLTKWSLWSVCSRGYESRKSEEVTVALGHVHYPPAGLQVLWSSPPCGASRCGLPAQATGAPPTSCHDRLPRSETIECVHMSCDYRYSRRNFVHFHHTTTAVLVVESSTATVYSVQLYT